MAKKTKQATGYANAQGVPTSAIGWNDEEQKVTLGGSSATAESTPSGKAQVDISVLQDMVDDYKKQTGIKSGKELSEIYSGKQADFDDLIAKMGKGFSYDPSKDVAYQEYLKQAEANAKKAYENAIGSLTAKTGGNLNSSAVSGASQSYNEQINKATSALPDYMTAAFNRYIQEGNSLQSIAKLLQAQQKQDYDVAKEISDTSIAQADKNYERQVKRETDPLDKIVKQITALFSRPKAQAELDQAQANLNTQALKDEQIKASTENTKADTDYTKAKTESEKKNDTSDLNAVKLKSALQDYFLQSAMTRGYFTEDEARYLGVSASDSPLSVYYRLNPAKLK